MTGNVYIDGIKTDKPGTKINPDAKVEIKQKSKYVSRGGYKLEKALTEFKISPKNKVCVDCGASTGGFTDCLLQNGAKTVYAVDVGYGQLDWKLRSDPAVKVMDRTNIRYMTPSMFEPRPQLAVIDLSFISLSKVLPTINEILTDDGEAICLIKPQFEAKKDEIGEKGIVRSAEIHEKVLENFLIYSKTSGFKIKAITHSPIKGAGGNVEYLAHITKKGKNRKININEIVTMVIDGGSVLKGPGS